MEEEFQFTAYNEFPEDSNVTKRQLKTNKILKKVLEMIQGLFSVPIKVGTIVPSEYEEAETDQLLSGLFLDGKLGDFTGETGLSTAPKVMNLHEKEELKWLTSSYVWR